MASVVELAGDITAAATAMSGLLLVFMGSTATAYEAYEPADKSAVRGKYRRRAYLAITAFVLTVLSAGLALGGKWLACPYMVDVAAVTLTLSFIAVVAAAVFTVRDIK